MKNGYTIISVKFYDYQAIERSPLMSTIREMGLKARQTPTPEKERPVIDHKSKYVTPSERSL